MTKGLDWGLHRALGASAQVMQSPGWGVWLWLGGRRWKGGLLSQARPGQRWPVRRWPGSPVQGGQGGQVVPWSGPKKCIEKNLISGGEIDFESSYLLYDISSRSNYYDGLKNKTIFFYQRLYVYSETCITRQRDKHHYQIPTDQVLWVKH